MGQRGPPRTPTEILRMRGSPLANRNPDEPTPQRGRPKCPRWLKTPARREWNHLVKLLDEMGVLTKVDGNALARYCRLWARWRKMEEFIDEHGVVYATKDRNGKSAGFRAFPQVRIAEKLSVQLTRLEQEFGLTPASRSRVSVQDAATLVIESAIDARKARFFRPAERHRARVTEEARRRASLPPE